MGLNSVKPLSNNTVLTSTTKWYKSMDAHSITACGQILVCSLRFMNNQYCPHNFSHQVRLPIIALVKHNDPNILETMKDWMVEKGYVFQDDFMIGLFNSAEDEFMCLYASFRTQEMAVLFKLVWG